MERQHKETIELPSLLMSRINLVKHHSGTEVYLILSQSTESAE